MTGTLKSDRTVEGQTTWNSTSTSPARHQPPTRAWSCLSHPSWQRKESLVFYGLRCGSASGSWGYPNCRRIGARAPVLHHSRSRSSQQSLYQPAPGGTGQRVEWRQPVKISCPVRLSGMLLCPARRTPAIRRKEISSGWRAGGFKTPSRSGVGSGGLSAFGSPPSSMVN
jgi:hypothetical protein